MKKIVAVGLLAACSMLATQQEASAWINAKFSIGLNWELQSGNNCFGWGLWQNGQVPGANCAPFCAPQPCYAAGPSYYQPSYAAYPANMQQPSYAAQPAYYPNYAAQQPYYPSYAAQQPSYAAQQPAAYQPSYNTTPYSQLYHNVSYYPGAGYYAAPAINFGR